MLESASALAIASNGFSRAVNGQGIGGSSQDVAELITEKIGDSERAEVLSQARRQLFTEEANTDVRYIVEYRTLVCVIGAHGKEKRKNR